MLRRTGPTPRPGFTMVELLVTVGIIAILVALTTAAVFKAVGSGKRASAVTDVNNLEIALTSFHRAHGFYPPSHVTETVTTSSGPVSYVRRFRIPNNYYAPETAVLKRMFPRWNPTYDPTTGVMSAGAPDGAGLDLDPNQVLVYFLSGPTQTGWNVGGPWAPPAGANTRKDPYFDFPPGKLQAVAGSVPHFVDPWGTPYAYFTANGVNYDARMIFPWVSGGATATFQWGTTPVTLEVAPNTAYTPALGANPFGGEQTYLAHPYGTAPTSPTPTITWTNPNRFQIVCAGPDQGFGAGSYMVTASPPVTWRAWANGRDEYISGGTGNVGYDDIANFNNGAQLGEPGASTN